MSWQQSADRALLLLSHKCQGIFCTPKKERGELDSLHEALKKKIVFDIFLRGKALDTTGGGCSLPGGRER